MWIHRFETVAQRKHWDVETRLDNLISRLQGKAQLSRHTLRQYSEHIKELYSRFMVVETTKPCAARFSQQSQLKQLKNMQLRCNTCMQRHMRLGIIEIDRRILSEGS